ncbi:MAG: MmcQ/YjbR family DNA-binding protein [Candidatus Nanopelagicales bacterium]
MTHPQLFDENDQVLARVRRIARRLPGTAEKVSHGRPAFFTTKVFAYYGGSVKVDGAYVQHPKSVMVLLDPDERTALVADARCYVPAYLGPSGWLGIDLEEADWSEVAESIESSYRRTARRSLVAELEGRAAAQDR